ncbi:MarR family winged helix-turn-helix transcriptional regulator [Tardibacter chloracetimidivorans]|nr:MarR family winged helix-turn-helix transcriptional regulator [Tardibacter chloracetimidivorans]
MPKFIEVLENIEHSLGRDICTCEHKIVVYLYDYGPSPARAIRPFCTGSTSKFFDALSKLAACGVLEVIDEQAKIRIYRLANEIAEMIDRQMLDLNDWFMSDSKDHTSSFSKEMRHSHDIVRNRFKSHTFYCDYQIIRYLYEMKRLSSSELRDLCSWSSTIFYTSIESIVEAGLVIKAHNPSDKRRVSYRLSRRTRKMLDADLGMFRSWYISKLNVAKLPVDMADRLVN